MKLRAIIVDDEELARQILREYLDKAGEVEIVAECANGFEAVKAVGEQRPDLLFLDIQMPKLDGFEVLELIDPPVAVIFVTAYDQYALKAFDAAAVDYLLKPFSTERLGKALERARALLSDPQPRALQASDLAAAARPPGQTLERVVVKDGTKVHIIPIAKLDYVEAQDDYVALHSAGKSYLKQQPIASLEALLDPARFVRIHRSAIVNVDFVREIHREGRADGWVLLADGDRPRMSAAGWRRLTACFTPSR